MKTNGKIGVAISTTGDEHRLRFLETCAEHWWRALAVLGLPTTVYVTVDGTEADTLRVADRVAGFAEVYRVGQPTGARAVQARSSRLGVATNKNTGLELLIDNAEVEHLFLSDDDCWPLYPESVRKHIGLVPHSIVGWGASRVKDFTGGMPLVEWNWPRGVMMYAHRDVVYRVGGMDERFFPGGHEHVEWSNRIFNAGITPGPFLSPASYATRNAMGARALWHCEDMIRPGEPRHEHAARKAALTSIRREPGDWDKINEIMAAHTEDTAYMPFRAHQNSRSSATLSANLSGQGVCAVEPESRGSEK